MSGTCGTRGKKIKDGKARTDFTWLRIETISGLLWPYSNEEIGPENSGNFSPT